MIIGITGTDGAGKGTVVDYLVTKRGFVHYSTSGFIAKEVERQGLPISRNQLRLTGNELREKFGNDVLVAKALEEVSSRGEKEVIIESIRALAEAETLKRNGGILLAVDADQTLRFSRVQSRRSDKDQVDLETFIAQEELEKNDPNPHGMQKAKVMDIADYTIYNDGTLVELEEKVDEFLKQYGN